MDRPFDLFKGLENTPGYTALKGVLRNLSDVLNPNSAAGQGLMAGLRELSTGLGEWLKPLTGKDGKANMIDFFASMKAGIDDVLPGLAAIVKVTGWFAGKMIKSGSGWLLGSELLEEMASGKSGRIGNVIKAIPGMLLPGDPNVAPAVWGKGGLRFGGAWGGGLGSSPGPGLLARSNVVTVQNTFHVHGSTDTDALAGKMNDLQQESFTAMVERLSLFSAGG